MFSNSIILKRDVCFGRQGLNLEAIQSRSWFCKYMTWHFERVCCHYTAEKAVSEQGSKVRALKEGQGMSNEDAQVKEAVTELLKRKEKLQQINDRLELVQRQPVESAV